MAKTTKKATTNAKVLAGKKSKDKKKQTYGESVDAKVKVIKAPNLPYKPAALKKYKPRIGLIACGGITQSHLTAYRAAGFNVVALCDLIPDRIEARRGEFYPDAFTTTDYHEILDRKDIDVVDVATHPPERYPILKDAINAGKHVLSQKPFVIDLDKGEELCDLADKKGVKFAVNQNGRWAPNWSYLRQVVDRGMLGNVLGAHLAVHWNHNWIAGGPFDSVRHIILYDFAIHWFDIVTQFMQGRKATRVFASNTHAEGQTAKPNLLGQALIEYDGAQATLVFDASTPLGSKATTYLAGTEGSALSTGPGIGVQEVTVYTKKGHFTPALQGSWFPDGFRGTMAELLSSIEQDRTPQNNARANLESLAVCFAACKSADTGKPQTPGKVRKLVK